MLRRIDSIRMTSPAEPPTSRPDFWGQRATRALIQTDVHNLGESPDKTQGMPPCARRTVTEDSRTMLSLLFALAVAGGSPPRDVTVVATDYKFAMPDTLPA